MSPAINTDTSLLNLVFPDIGTYILFYEFTVAADGSGDVELDVGLFNSTQGTWLAGMDHFGLSGATNVPPVRNHFTAFAVITTVAANDQVDLYVKWHNAGGGNTFCTFYSGAVNYPADQQTQMMAVADVSATVQAIYDAVVRTFPVS